MSAPENPPDTHGLEDREQLESLLAGVRREVALLPPVKPLFIVAAFALAGVFMAALGGMVAGMLAADDLQQPRGGMSNVLGLIFFLMPVVLMLRYGITRLLAARRLARLRRVEGRLLERLGDAATGA